MPSVTTAVIIQGLTICRMHRRGLDRCRYKDDRGMKRWVGIGVTADLEGFAKLTEPDRTPENLVIVGKAVDTRIAN
jgi:hypothetical protein